MAALRGDPAQAVPLINATIAAAEASGRGIAATYAHWAAAILNNGLGRYRDALAAARCASQEAPALCFANVGASRTGRGRGACGDLENCLRGSCAARRNDAGRGDRLRPWRSGALHGRWSAMARPPRGCTARRSSTGSVRPSSARNSRRAHLLFGDGCAGGGGAEAPAPTSRGLRDAHRDRARVRRTGPPRADGRRGARPQAHDRDQSDLTPRRRRSLGWLATASPTRESAPDCSSARAPSSGICVRSSRSSASDRASSYAASCLTRDEQAVSV